MQTRCLILAFLLTGCATVNYNYDDKACQALGRSKDGEAFILRCPIVTNQNWYLERTHERNLRD